MITVRTKTTASVKEVIRFFNRNFPEAILKVCVCLVCLYILVYFSLIFNYMKREHKLERRGVKLTLHEHILIFPFSVSTIVPTKLKEDIYFNDFGLFFNMWHLSFHSCIEVAK